MIKERRMRRTCLLAAASVLSLAFAGCAVGPDYKTPITPLAGAFHNAATQSPSPAAAAFTSETWWTGFNDPLLTKVVERALSQNLDLAAARARLIQSRAAAKAAGAALLPKGDLQTSASDVRQSLLSPFGAVGSHIPGFERDYDLDDFGVAASWEIDLFGGLRRAREAAKADAEAAQDDARAARVTVAAEAADAYLQVRAYQARLLVAQRQAETETRLVDLLGQRRADGVASDRELNQAKAALEGVNASVPPLQAGEEAQLNRLDVLMGAEAGTYAAEIAQADGKAAALPTPPPLTDLGAPADLLRRRPDILAAERRLAASNARIGASVADYYPKISITGLLGYESLDASQIFTGEALQHGVTGGLRWRLFDFGRVDAEVAAAKGRNAEALAGYRAAVYRATGEVETALSDRMRSQAQATALGRQIAALTLARDQAEDAYRGGVVSLIEVLDADRDLLTASDQLARARADADRAAVASYRALGLGGGAV